MKIPYMYATAEYRMLMTVNESPELHCHFYLTPEDNGGSAIARPDTYP